LTPALRWGLLVVLAGVTVWLRLLPLALPGLDAGTQAAFRYQGDDGRAYTYLGDFDSYVWLRAARTYLRTGTICDAVVAGVCRDTQTHAPVGREMRYGRSLHVVAIVGLHRVITAVRPDYPLPATAYLVPVILGTLVILPAFGIGRRLGGDVAGLAAAATVALNPFVLSRTAGSDNDIWNVVLPLCVVWAIVRALGTPALRARVAWTLVAAGFVGLHAGTWRGWIFGYAIVLAALVGQGVLLGLRALVGVSAGPRGRALLHAVRGPAIIVGVYWVACLATTTVAGAGGAYLEVPATMVGRLAASFAPAATTPPTSSALRWPHAFASVGELYRPDRHELGVAVGGELPRLLGWAGLVLLLLPWRGWRWWHGVAGVAGAAMVARVLFGPELGRDALLRMLLVPPLLAASVHVLLDPETDDSGDYGARVVVAVWFVAAAAVAPDGARFVLLFIAPFALAFGHVLGRVQRLWAMVPRPVGGFAMPMAALVLVGVLVPTARLTHAVAGLSHPRIHDAWWETFVALRDRTPPDAILHLWWDYGYWAKYVAERRVSADGGSLLTRIPYWLARSLLAADEEQAVGLLRMLDCGSAASPEPEGAQSAYRRLVAHGFEPEAAWRAVGTLAARDGVAADAFLAEHELAPPARRDVLAASHCAAPPAYLILSGTQVRMSAWKTLARWRPGHDEPDATEPRDLLTLAWVRCDASAGGRWQCPVPPALTGGRSLLRTVEFDPDTPASVRLTFRRDGGTPVVATPALVVRADATARVETEVPAGRARLAVLIDVPHARVLVGPSDVIRSTFVHLMFLDGRYARHLVKVDDRRGAEGERVATWRIDWPASAREQPLERRDDGVRGVGARRGAHAGGGGGTCVGRGCERAQAGGERGGVPGVLAAPGESGLRRERAGVGGLVVEGGGRERDQQRRQADQRELGEGAGAGAGDGHVGPAIGGADVVDVRGHRRRDAAAGVGGGDAFGLAGPGLMVDGDGDAAGAETGQQVGHARVQERRTARAADHQYPEGVGGGSRSGRGVGECGAHRHAGDVGRGRGERRGRRGGAEQDAVGEAAEQAVGDPGHRVGFVDDRAQAEGARAQDGAGRGVAAEAEDQFAPGRAQDGTGGGGAARQRRERAQLAGGTDAEQRRSRNGGERIAVRGHQAGLDAPGGAEKGDRDARDEDAIGVGDGERGVHVSARSAGGDRDATDSALRRHGSLLARC
jgi:hypothetical protein